MQFRLITSFIIFTGSYLPLSLILLAQNFDYAALDKPICWAFWASNCTLPLKNPGLALSIFFACVACFMVTLLVLALVKPKHEIVVTSASHVPADLMNYTLPYIVSFMSLDYQEPGKFVGVLIFMAWMFFITHKSGQILLNPVLIAFGWRLYDLTYRYAGDQVEHTSRALSLAVVTADERVRQVPVQDLLIIKHIPEVAA